MKDRESWHVSASDFTKKCRNPIRLLVENMNLTPNPNKPMIALSVGDPTVFGNLKTADQVIEGIVESARSSKFNGYAPSAGYLEAREAVCKYLAKSGETVDAKDVILCSGCSYAIEMCITVLANPGQNILVPRPGFPLYKSIADSLGIECRHYNLMPDMGWDVDIDHMASLIDSNTAAILVNNPSNPCGSVFSARHLTDILNVAVRHYVPIIADEIYEHFVFKGETFHSMSSLTKDVPILTCSGITKRFLVPGWRLGWVVIHDRHNAFAAEVSPGLSALSQRIMGGNTLVQGSLDTILNKTPQSFFDETVSVVERNARLAFEELSQAPGLKPVMPSGAMYMMVGFDMDMFPDFKTDLSLVERMVSEESIFCLPGGVFELPGYVRLVLTVPETHMREACSRIRDFCNRHCRVPALTYRGTFHITEMPTYSLTADDIDRSSTDESKDYRRLDGDKNSRLHGNPFTVSLPK